MLNAKGTIRSPIRFKAPLAALLAAALTMAPGISVHPAQAAPAPVRRQVIVRLLPDVAPQAQEAPTAAQKVRGPARARKVAAMKERGGKRLVALADYAKAHPGTGYRELWLTGGAVMELTDAEMAEVASLPGVDSVEAVKTFGLPPTEVSAATITGQWNLLAINAQPLWQKGVDGAGAVVAVVDSGATPAHLDLAPGYLGDAAGWFDATTEGSTTAVDHLRHGTNVLGLAVGGDSSGGNIGVAPAASWMAVKIYDAAGISSNAAVHLALQHLLDPDQDPATDDAPDVVNGSWGFDAFPDQCVIDFLPDIDALRALGISVVFSAGNSGNGPGVPSSLSPANYANTLSVGMVDDTMAVASSSSRGPSPCDGAIFPDLVAPGVLVKTTDTVITGAAPAPYVILSGTSFASPHVAGAVALLKSAFPDRTGAEIEAALASTAADILPAGPDNDSGNGVIDLAAAFDALLPAYCTDGDFDNFYAEAGCTTKLDCAPQDPAINPLAAEVCDDGVDNDCDTLIDMDDPDCQVVVDPPPPQPEPPSSGGGGGGCMVETLDCGD